jgi:poly-beta-1,6-N-acetyl-D-glucosamine synthase
MSADADIAPRRSRQSLQIVCVVPFLNEQQHLPALLGSIAAQTRFPDLLALVDDGSTDASREIVDAFVRERARARVCVRLLARPPRPRERDRLAQAAELRAFTWALAQITQPWDLAVKLDADLELDPRLFEALEAAFVADPQLGIAGARLSSRDAPEGMLLPERCPPQHVRGATKFYRRACLEQIMPLQPILGWDTIDEIAARRRGWRTESLPAAGAHAVHLRPTGSSDGLLRAQHRWGACAYGIGQHPLWVVLSAVRRLRERPRLVGSAAFLAGYAGAGLRRRPRAPAEVRAFGQREQLTSLRRRATRRERAQRALAT